MRKWSRAINLARKKLKEATSHKVSSLAPQPFPEFDWTNVRKVMHKVMVAKPVEQVRSLANISIPTDLMFGITGSRYCSTCKFSSASKDG